MNLGDATTLAYYSNNFSYFDLVVDLYYEDV